MEGCTGIATEEIPWCDNLHPNGGAAASPGRSSGNRGEQHAPGVLVGDNHDLVGDYANNLAESAGPKAPWILLP